MGRRLARELALKVLYRFEEGDTDLPSVIEKVLEAKKYQLQDKDFSRTLVQRTVANLKELDDRISKVIENWEYDRLSVIDKIILRIGTCEILYFDDIPPQISINEASGGLRRCSPGEYDVSDFIPSLDEDKIKKLLDTVKKDITAVENVQLKNLLNLLFNDSKFVKDYSHSPSAITHHHNYVGGNLEHTVGVIRLCKSICEMYEGINKDLVIAGAILHDIGKLREYETGAAIEKTSEGNFIGHIVMGDRWIREKIADLRKKGKDFDQDLEDKLCHIILSHHGKYEFGSPRMPQTIEATVIHAADMMDSQVKNFIQNINEGRKTSEDEWAFVWDSDAGIRRPMYLGED